MAIRCPKCGSTNVNISMVSTGAKTTTRKAGIMSWVGRTLLIMFTAGLWLFVTKRRTQSRTTIKNKKIAVCQSCGHSWKV